MEAAEGQPTLRASLGLLGLLQLLVEVLGQGRKGLLGVATPLGLLVVGPTIEGGLEVAAKQRVQVVVRVELAHVVDAREVKGSGAGHGR